MDFHFRATGEYDKKIKHKGMHIPYASKKMMKKIYPQGGFKVLGEICGEEQKEILGKLLLNGGEYDVRPVGSSSALLWCRAGYLQTGEQEYLAVMRSRIPFLVLWLCLGALLMLLLGALWGQLDLGKPDVSTGGSQVVIRPEGSLPDSDENAEPMEGDSSEKPDKGSGGSLLMTYMLECRLSLSDKKIGIYFQNPHASTHNVALDMYIVSDGEEYLIAQSGLLEAGYSLETLTMLEDGPVLSEGIYSGLFRLHCFDPEDGKQEMIVPEITGLTITVTK